MCGKRRELGGNSRARQVDGSFNRRSRKTTSEPEACGIRLNPIPMQSAQDGLGFRFTRNQL